MNTYLCKFCTAKDDFILSLYCTYVSLSVHFAEIKVTLTDKLSHFKMIYTL